jgi:hypothetical protein
MKIVEAGYRLATALWAGGNGQEWTRKSEDGKAIRSVSGKMTVALLSRVMNL